MLHPGETIDAWVIERPLGAGGMGSVYLCHNRGARRILAAVKVLDARLDANPRVRARFVREAELLFGLDHPNIVKVRSIRMEASPPYIEMEFVDGRSLDALVETGALAPGDVARIGAQVASALAHVHARGVFHRDVKPSNIVVQADGVAKLVDFGIAAEAGSATVSEAGQAIGSAAYIPPEWMQGGAAPAAWDSYGLGVVLHELLTGAEAFPNAIDGTPLQRFMATLSAKQGRGALDVGVGNAPDALRAIVRALTNPDPAERRTDLGAVADELRALAAPGEPAFLARVRGPVVVEAPVAQTWDGSFAGPGPGSLDVPVEAGAGAGGVGTLDSSRAGAGEGRGAPGVALPVSPEPSPASSHDAGAAPTVSVATPRTSLWIGIGVASLAVVAALAWRVGGDDPAAQPPVATVAAVPTVRPVTLTIRGAEEVAEVRLDGTALAPTPGGDGATWEVAPILPGTHVLEFRRGAGCETTPVAETCAVQTMDVVVPAGEGRWSTALDAPAPRRRAVVVREGGGRPLVLRVGEATTGPAVDTVRIELPVGVHTASATGPGCPPPPCAEACPPACARWEGALSVPDGVGDLALTVTLTEGAATAQLPSKPTSGVATAPRDAAPRPAGAPVSVAELAAWLAAHPAWAREAAVAAGKADADYLAGWTGAVPPAGSSGPALATSPAVAQAYCGARGLPRVVDLPASWDLTAGPWHEWRLESDGSVVGLRNDGQALKAGPTGRTGKYTGIRCAR